MTKQEKAKALKFLFGLVVVFAVYLIIFFNITVTEETHVFWVKQHDFVVTLWANIKDNIVIYGFLAGAVVGLYYFLVYKPKISKSKITSRKR